MPPRRPSVRKHLGSIKRAIAGVEKSFALLHARVRAAERLATRSSRNPVLRKLRLTPKRRAQLKLQGRYMGFMRQLKPAQKAKVKAMKMKRGMRAAIGAAKRLAEAKP